MNNKKGPFGDGPEENNTPKVYITYEKRARINRNFQLLIIVVMFMTISAVIAQCYRIKAENTLAKTQWQLEAARAENDSLQSTLQFMQSENDALRNQVELEPAIVYKTVCSTSTFKSWMDYRAITSKASDQYNLQKKATTDSFYGFRKIGDYIMVAMGPQYGPVGTKYIVQFEDKKVLQIIIGDIKHLGCQSSDSSMVEFIVDSSVIPNSIKSSGNFNSVFSGSITVIQEVLT